MKNILPNEAMLFHFGAEGGGATVSRLPNNSVIERGSSGGITGDEDDPFREWERAYSSWEDWWKDFTSKHKETWIYFYPAFIHPDIKKFVQSAVDNYKSERKDFSHQIENWRFQLNREY